MPLLGRCDCCGERADLRVYGTNIMVCVKCRDEIAFSALRKRREEREKMMDNPCTHGCEQPCEHAKPMPIDKRIRSE